MPQTRFTLDNKDIAEAARLHAGIVGPRYWVWIVMIILMPTLIQQHFSWQITLEVGATTVLCVLIRLYTRRVTGRTGSWFAGSYATLTFRIDRVAAAPQAITWNDNGLEATTPFGTKYSAWSAFKRWAERDGLFLLYTSQTRYRILPRRAFLGVAEIDELETHLTRAGVRRTGPARRRHVPKSEAIVEAF